MKKVIAVIALTIISVGALTLNARPRALRQVVIYAEMDCAKCEKKIVENVSFEKGVVDLKTVLADKTVTIVYDAAKTDTTMLAKSIRKLGYAAKVLSDKQKTK